MSHKTMNHALDRIMAKKQRLDGFRPFNPSLIKNLDDWLRIELTYNSNAIEGNTLSRADTLLIVEKGITAKGKSIVEHQEAINHAHAYDYIVKLIEDKEKISLNKVVMNVHAFILNKINDQYKGRYRDVPVRIQASQVVLPNPLKVPEKMEEFFVEVGQRKNRPIPDQAIFAHYELVSMHPFIDGNGRTARLLMNYILLKNGFAPAFILKEERSRYLNSLEEYQLFGKSEKYFSHMYEAIERGLDEYLIFFKKPPLNTEGKLLKIGELATLSGVTIASIRHWTKEGLLTVHTYTKGNYQLYKETMIAQVHRIRDLQQEGLNLSAIKKKILL